MESITVGTEHMLVLIEHYIIALAWLVEQQQCNCTVHSVSAMCMLYSTCIAASIHSLVEHSLVEPAE